MGIKAELIQTLEANKFFLNRVLRITNQYRIGESNLEVSNVHFKNNEIVIKGADNTFKCESNAYMRNGKVWIDGAYNTVIIENGSVISGDSICHTFHIDGHNNCIFIGKNCKINNTTFGIWGGRNTIILEDNCSTMRTEFHIEQDNNEIKLGRGCTFHGRVGYPVHMALDEGSKVIVGDDCMFANGIQIRSTDSHSIVDLKGKRINPAKNIYIGEHCWIGLGAIVLKGTEILSHTVVGAGAVCNSQYQDENCILAGNPAKVVKREIDWERKFL